jgi:hypothetical protein
VFVVDGNAPTNKERAMNAEDSASNGPTQTVRVLVCRVGQAPVVEELTAGEEGHHLDAMQAIVGGLVTVISLEQGIDLWCNDEGILRGFPLNRVIPTVAPKLPPGFENAFLIMRGDDLAHPGEPGEWRIYGDFFLARSTPDGEIASVTDDDIAKYQARWSPIV